MIANRYTGRPFNGVIDGYERQPDQLVHLHGEPMLRPVRYNVDGVIIMRQMGPTDVTLSLPRSPPSLPTSKP